MRWLAAAALAALCCTTAPTATLALSRNFVQKIKDKVTVATRLEVDVVAARPHAISSSGDDGALHVAGRSNEIGLPLVAVIQNAAMETEAMALLKKSRPSNLVAVTGAWRIWFEHAGGAPQVQFAPVDIPTNSNPDHVFEIRPLTAIGGLNLAHAGEPIPRYVPTPARTAFASYETLTAQIRATATAVMIDSVPTRYNYAEFVIVPAGNSYDVGDGYMVLASVYDANGETRVTAVPRRMAFLKGTPPADQASKLRKGDRLHVMGIPRVNLSEVYTLMLKAGAKGASVNLPYEMVVVAILPD